MSAPIKMSKHLFLIGMPGSGKSSLGRRAAREAGVPFEDTDEMIVRASGMSVNDFFAQYGEPAFRRAETHVLEALTRMRPSIVSTGGGLPMNPLNRQIMKNWGGILLLDRPLEDILATIRTENRPLLQDNAEEKLRELYDLRMPVYRETADYTLVNDCGYEAALGKVLNLLRERFRA